MTFGQIGDDRFSRLQQSYVQITTRNSLTINNAAVGLGGKTNPTPQGKGGRRNNEDHLKRFRTGLGKYG